MGLNSERAGDADPGTFYKGGEEVKFLIHLKYNGHPDGILDENPTITLRSVVGLLSWMRKLVRLTLFVLR